MYDVIVMGGGPSGMACALYLLRNNKKVLILEKEAFGGQIAKSPHLENFPTRKELSGSKFAEEFFDQILSLGVEFELEEVLEVKKENDIFKVKTNYNSYESKAFVIANGVSERMLNLENEIKLIGKGISYCAVCDGPFFKGKETYLIGDANTALQYALLLTDYSPKVHLITLFDKFFGDKILVDRVRNNPKIEITHNMSAIQLLGNNELTGVVFENTKTHEKVSYRTDNLFIAIGQIPHNDIFKGMIEMEKGFIKVDSNMKTSLEGIYAVGDTTVKDNRQVITACSDGSIAAVSILKAI